MLDGRKGRVDEVVARNSAEATISVTAPRWRGMRPATTASSSVVPYLRTQTGANEGFADGVRAFRPGDHCQWEGVADQRGSKATMWHSEQLDDGEKGIHSSPVGFQREGVLYHRNEQPSLGFSRSAPKAESEFAQSNSARPRSD